MDIEKMMVEVLCKIGKLEAVIEDLTEKVDELKNSKAEKDSHNRKIVDAPTKNDFLAELEHRIGVAMQEGNSSVTINAGELHRAVGGYPGPSHRMPSCVSVMRSLIDIYNGDIIDSPESGMGARFTVEYKLR